MTEQVITPIYDGGVGMEVDLKNWESSFQLLNQHLEMTWECGSQVGKVLDYQPT